MKQKKTKWTLLLMFFAVILYIMYNLLFKVVRNLSNLIA